MPKQPFRVTLLLWLVLLLTTWNALRAWTALAWHNVLIEFLTSPLYIGISGLIWLGVGIWLLWSLIRHEHYARTMLLVTALSYTAWIWIERLFFEAPRENWPFALAENLVLLSFVFVVSKYWKREAHDRKSPDPETN